VFKILSEGTGIKVDSSTKDPARLSRYPGNTRVEELREEKTNKFLGYGKNHDKHQKTKVKGGRIPNSDFTSWIEKYTTITVYEKKAKVKHELADKTTDEDRFYLLKEDSQLLIADELEPNNSRHAILLSFAIDLVSVGYDDEMTKDFLLSARDYLQQFDHRLISDSELDSILISATGYVTGYEENAVSSNDFMF
jgi:hypothetical protein